MLFARESGRMVQGLSWCGRSSCGRGSTAPGADCGEVEGSEGLAGRRVGGAGEVQEDVLEVRLAGRDVDDAEAFALQRRQHLAGIHLVLAVGDGEDPRR